MNVMMRERRGHGDVARRGRAAGDQAEQVAEQNEEEERQAERHVALAAVPAEHRDVDLVAQVEDDRLEPGGESLGPPDVARVPRVRPRRAESRTMHRMTAASIRKTTCFVGPMSIRRGRRSSRASAEARPRRSTPASLLKHGYSIVLRVRDVRHDDVGGPELLGDARCAGLLRAHGSRGEQRDARR